MSPSRVTPHPYLNLSSYQACQQRLWLVFDRAFFLWLLFRGVSFGRHFWSFTFGALLGYVALQFKLLSTSSSATTRRSRFLPSWFFHRRLLLSGITTSATFVKLPIEPPI